MVLYVSSISWVLIQSTPLDIATDCADKLADLRSSGLSSPTARKDFLDSPIKTGNPKLLNFATLSNIK